ncbi:MAG: shikimate kinase [Frankiales bacterium]|nr:shikimate kinase [Frankiales bacterium]
MTSGGASGGAKDVEDTRLLLVGCTGSGRTSVGSLVASRLGWPFLDDDAVLQRTTGRDVAALYREQGLDAVVSAEAATVNIVLGVPGPLVASIATGVLLQEGGRDRLRQGGRVVWLRASAATLARRVGRAEERPWLGEDPAATLARFVAERYPLYASVADQVLDVDVLPVGQVARAVVEAMP